MCYICKTVRRKKKGESWDKQMCKNCYRLTDHYSWDNRWQLTQYVTKGAPLPYLIYPIDLYNSGNN